MSGPPSRRCWHLHPCVSSHMPPWEQALVDKHVPHRNLQSEWQRDEAEFMQCLSNCLVSLTFFLNDKVKGLEKNLPKQLGDAPAGDFFTPSLRKKGPGWTRQSWLWLSTSASSPGLCLQGNQEHVLLNHSLRLPICRGQVIVTVVRVARFYFFTLARDDSYYS